MWWILVVVVAAAIVGMWLIYRGRGSSGASKAEDVPPTAAPMTPGTGFDRMPKGGGAGGPTSERRTRPQVRPCPPSGSQPYQVRPGR